MKILILEDSTGRMQKFAQWLQGHEIKLATSTDEAFLLLTNHNFDYVFLDFELGYDQLPGNDFTRRWKRNKEKVATQNPKVLVHTSSDAGASLMITDLRLMQLAYVRMPFYNINKAFIDGFMCQN